MPSTVLISASPNANSKKNESISLSLPFSSLRDGTWMMMLSSPFSLAVRNSASIILDPASLLERSGSTQSHLITNSSSSSATSVTPAASRPSGSGSTAPIIKDLPSSISGRNSLGTNFVNKFLISSCKLFKITMFIKPLRIFPKTLILSAFSGIIVHTVLSRFGPIIPPIVQRMSNKQIKKIRKIKPAKPVLILPQI